MSEGAGASVGYSGSGNVLYSYSVRNGTVYGTGSYGVGKVIQNAQTGDVISASPIGYAYGIK